MIIDVRAKHGLVLELVEFCVFSQVMKELDLDFCLAVGERTEALIFTFVNIMRMLKAELPLVLLWMIKFFNFIVGFSTIVAQRTAFASGESFTEIIGIFVDFWRSSSVLVKVIKVADFGVMVALDHALLGLERAQLELFGDWTFMKSVFSGKFNLFFLLEFFKGQSSIIFIRMIHWAELGD